MPRNTVADYRHRPLPVALANLAGRVVPATAVASLDPQRLMRSATRRAGQEDFGPGEWRPGFERLCTALEDEARLNLVGRLSARNHLLQLLENRLDIEAARSDDPAIAAQRIDAPVFVTGLPRTGSTLLHSLLAQDPSLRVPWTWEVMLPGRQPPGADPRADERRIARTDSLLAWVHRLAPRFRAIHPIGAALPQECIAITAHAFASVEFKTTFNVPSYQAWLDATPAAHETALRYHLRFLQHLQRHSATNRWVLKAPAHLHNLDAIVTAYPDARFVFTMRDPVEVVASIASHGVTLASAFSDAVDYPALARYWMRWWAEGYRRAVHFRLRHPQRFVDLEYVTLVADPVAAVRQLYEALGMRLDDNAAVRMRRFLDDNRQDQHGRHRYSLEQFGLDRAEVERLFPAA